jgi:hypothetical protein
MPELFRSITPSDWSRLRAIGRERRDGAPQRITSALQLYKMNTPTQPTEGAMRAAKALDENASLVWPPEYSHITQEDMMREVARIIDAETGADKANAAQLHQRVKALEDALRYSTEAITGLLEILDMAVGCGIVSQEQPVDGPRGKAVAAIEGANAILPQSPTSAQVGTERNSAGTLAKCPTCHGGGWIFDHDTDGNITTKMDCPDCDGAPAITETRRLDWLLNYITAHGINGLFKLAWTVYDEDGVSLMNQKLVSEDDVGEVLFDRAAIDSAMDATEAASAEKGEGAK